MRLGWLTDLHLNFLAPQDVDTFMTELASIAVDAFVITGDIGEAASLPHYLSLFDQRLDIPVYFVLGNHDFYGGSISKVRQEVDNLAAASRRLVYLSMAEFIPLTRSTCLVGHDGWADGRLGDFAGSGVLLNDFFLIDELKADSSQPQFGSIKKHWLPAMQWLAQEAADSLYRHLPTALAAYDHVIVATHVPPFREACWHEGTVSADEHLPFFASGVTGDVLRAQMVQHPKKQMTVLCGHTHGAGEATILPNLRVLSGGAEYGSPGIQRIIEVA